jgi:hypothetical protein
VAIDPRSQRISDTHLLGEVTWWPRATSGIVEIRAEVADAAGNPAVSHAQVDLVDSRPPVGAVRDRGLAATAPPHATTDAPGAWRGANDAVPLARRLPGPDLSPPASAPPTVPAPSPGVGVQTSAAPVPSVSGAASALAAALAQSPSPVASASPIKSAVPPSVAMRFSPALADPYPASRSAAPIAAVSVSGNSMRPKMVNAREFQLDYDVSTSGASGVARVEVWGTRDGGQSWRMFAADDRGHNPILVSVDEEGLYGFRIVVPRGGSPEPPQRGDTPDIWIGVDLTRPVGRFTGVQEGKGDQSDRLYIDWETSDRAPAAHGAALSFSSTPQGPWTRIAEGLEPSGRYVWQLDRGLPGQLYLRLEVRDEAGNVATIDAPDPVVLDYVRPLARTRDMRPLN